MLEKSVYAFDRNQSTFKWKYWLLASYYMKCLNKTWRTATSCPKLNIEEIDVIYVPMHLAGLKTNMKYITIDAYKAKCTSWSCDRCYFPAYRTKYSKHLNLDELIQVKIKY